jgi:hypothetical protein
MIERHQGAFIVDASEDLIASSRRANGVGGDVGLREVAVLGGR